AALAYEAQQSFEHRRIGENGPFDIVQEYGVPLLDLRILQILDIVVERGYISVGVLGHEIQRQIAQLNRGMVVAAVDAQIHNQKLSRLLRLHQRVPWNS